MLLGGFKTIKDHIIETLALFPYSKGPELLQKVQQCSAISKQAFYAALRLLLQDEIVLKVNQQYVIGSPWAKKLTRLLGQNKKTLDQDAISFLKDKEFINYSFSSMLLCDRYWIHIMRLLIAGIDKKTPITCYNPHQWFMFGRKKEDQEFLQLFDIHKKYCCYSVGGNAPLDRLFKKQLATKYLQVHTGASLFKKQNYYVNVFGDFLIEVFLDKKLAQNIEGFYQTHTTSTIKDTKVFEEMTAKQFPVRMKLSRDKKRAENIRKKILKDYYIPKID